MQGDGDLIKRGRFEWVRIHIVPYSQAPQSERHYVDCAAGNTVEYERGRTLVSQEDLGGVFNERVRGAYASGGDEENITPYGGV